MWRYLQKIIKGPASLSMAHDRVVAHNTWLNSKVVN